jgi:alkanesulfonate monooxygenase SsuD/methylene tetrahydromethanopterin reductase-like flavin-dependent oxidoreductase (luciferase family)
MKDLKLGMQMGYWGAGPDPRMVSVAQEAERLGYDAIFTAEAWGSDVFTPLAWIGAHTDRIRHGHGSLDLGSSLQRSHDLGTGGVGPAGG